MSHCINLSPPAKQLITGIRSIGYSFSTAISDIIDNSITAEAKNIHINFDPLEQNPYIAIIDDGKGMTRDEIINAMIFGSSRPQSNLSDKDLGRFGLGLKTASLSQCAELIVVSKRNGLVSCFSYDVDRIIETNSWILLDLSDKNDIMLVPEIDKLIELESGTIVVWRKFDRIEKNTEKFETSFRRLIEDAFKHVALVFHRFFNIVNISFNGKRIPRRDPFLLESKGRQQTGRISEIELLGSKIIVTPYSLPFVNSLNEEEKELLGGNTKNLYEEQGFYIYRNKRLIIWGSWLHMGFRSDLNTLARIQIDIDSSLDFAFSLDIKKSTAQIPDLIKSKIRAAVNDANFRSSRVLRHKGLEEKHLYPKMWIRTYDNKTNLVAYSINRLNNPLIDLLVTSLDERQKKILDLVFKNIELYLPKQQLHLDQIDNLLPQSENALNLEDKIEELLKIIRSFPAQSRINTLEILLKGEPYIILKEKRDQLMEQIYDDK